MAGFATKNENNAKSDSKHQQLEMKKYFEKIAKYELR